jgi:hypothetical protein
VKDMNNLNMAVNTIITNTLNFLNSLMVQNKHEEAKDMKNSNIAVNTIITNTLNFLNSLMVQKNIEK